MSLFAKKTQPVPRRRQSVNNQTSVHATDQQLDQRYAFRRNRTLTGSASSQVVSSGERTAQLKSPRVQAHDLAAQRRNLAVVLAAVTMIIVILYMLVSQFTARVVVRTGGDITTSLDASYAAAIESYLSAQPIERLRFMLNQDHLNSELQAALPEVASVTMDGGAGLGATSFVITMRTPIAGWSINGANQYVDATGTSFTRNYFQPPAVQIVDNSGVQAAAGQAVASNQFLGFVGRIVGQTSASGYMVTQVIIPQGTTRQVELRLKSVPYPVKVSVDRPAGEQIEDMTRAVKWLSSHGQTPQYLDVRVSGRAFYL